MTWYTASFKDKGAGMNRQSFYVEGSSRAEAEEVARNNCANDMDPDHVKLAKLGDLEDGELYKKLLRGGYNTAYTRTGDKIGKSDVEEMIENEEFDPDNF